MDLGFLQFSSKEVACGFNLKIEPFAIQHLCDLFPSISLEHQNVEGLESVDFVVGKLVFVDENIYVDKCVARV